ncbi:MAG: hypothetical protein DRJ03_10355 [Chloroflexi bacterium]|nr:MAG: hypothetical protein DRI81_04575 [Chloroflexota bacterium]RLC85877.1 MAG: hypothetical protein DRJ03_10355 [Chloroflexota bacterium]
MSGFAVIYNRHTPLAPQDEKFTTFRRDVVDFKQVGGNVHNAVGSHCAAAKFDTPSTRHHAIVRDAQTTAWLIATGTVLHENAAPDWGLDNLLRDYLETGQRVLTDLDGTFALAIYDPHTNKLIVATDPMGFTSVFYGQQNNRTYVATSALAVAKAVHALPDEYGVSHYLNVGCVYGTITLWSNVRRLPPGTLLEITPTGVTEIHYWRPSLDPAVMKLSLADTIDYTEALFSRLTARHLTSEAPMWADLTAGFDSRLVTMFLAQQSVPFRASCQGPVDSPDVLISMRIAKSLGWDYQHHILPDDWGQQRPAYLARVLGKADGHLDVFKQSSVIWDQDQRAPYATTSVWGLGGEVWRGTVWKQEFWNTGRTRTPNYDRLLSYRVMPSLDPTLFRDPQCAARVRSGVKRHLKSIGDEFADWPNTAQLDRVFTYKATGRSGAQMSAVMGLQRVLAPLNFKESISAAMSIHFRWRQHSRLVRHLMARVNPELAAFPTTDGGPALPMCLSNITKFRRYWISIGKQLVRKASQATLGYSILPPLRDEFDSYPLARWRRETLDILARDNILNIKTMRSAALYDPERLAAFLQTARNDDFKQEPLLSRIITVEMALRTLDTAL